MSDSGLLHLIKLSVGSESVESLGEWQRRRFLSDGECWHGTRMMPRRADELLDGGSIYWVIQGFIQARQRLVALRPVRRDDGVRAVRFVYDCELVRTELAPRRAFQGWRYLRGEDAPADLVAGRALEEAGMSLEMRRVLREAGLL
ncbi:MAG: DUF1489 domain-containing protein [Alphaproteobacteria bacterium]|nr:DUF1489 domain-containing protein [Alphaproteobacteria bacterium]MDA7983705.1 DUF1489 domain-containing protein [Alphaproteobacteria bacterium]MDA7989238.1 DUF1489 domain-containing protein [Alphaproteobacteria bacterium]MDA8030421.1 DUF1489 domain-containing protein [Alphaproteobacteria bacterium]